ncbi:hypothetical protein ACFXP7_02990 [Microbacterium sp. P06]|uniref:hypothetical protein n=1 Tax=Microbacterium sp. P06 TaxID=3366949 RepID=UPI00374583E4
MSVTNESDEVRGVSAASTDQVPGAGAAPADSYGGAVSDETPAATPAPGTQNAPVQDMHDTTDEDKIAGIVAQTRQDVGDKDQARIADVLRQRFDETGVHVANDRVAALAAEVANG